MNSVITYHAHHSICNTLIAHFQDAMYYSYFICMLPNIRNASMRSSIQNIDAEFQTNSNGAVAVLR
jgi:hypothetical protein